MKRFFHRNRILILGLVISILLHAFVFFVKFPVSLLPTQQEAPSMELRFVLHNQSSAFVVSNDERINQETASNDQFAENHKTDEMGRNANEVGQADPVSLSKHVIHQSSPASSKGSLMTDDGRYSGNGDIGGNGDARSVVFRRGVSQSHASYGQTRPVITASTRNTTYAMYYRTLRKRIEHIGMINFPQYNGARMYGELTVRIPLYQNGSIYEREGGLSIEQSSGNTRLDKAALDIVRRAAPFGPLPKNAQTTDIWIIITRLKFAREGAHSQIQSTVR